VKNRKNDRSDASLHRITLEMFMGPGLEPVLPSGRLSQKCIHINWIRLPGGDKNTHSPLCVYTKKTDTFEGGDSAWHLETALRNLIVLLLPSWGLSHWGSPSGWGEQP